MSGETELPRPSSATRAASRPSNYLLGNLKLTTNTVLGALRPLALALALGAHLSSAVATGRRYQQIPGVRFMKAPQLTDCVSSAVCTQHTGPGGMDVSETSQSHKPIWHKHRRLQLHF